MSRRHYIHLPDDSTGAWTQQCIKTRTWFAIDRTGLSRQRVKLLGDGVFVAPSTIPGAGRGLFAARTLQRGDCITSMDGVVFGGSNAAYHNIEHGYPHSHFCTLLHDTLWLDGFHAADPPDGIGGGSFANDISYAQGGKNNAEFRKVYDGRMPTTPVMFLFARQNILANEEIFVGYGSQYWTGPDSHTEWDPRKKRYEEKDAETTH